MLHYHPAVPDWFGSGMGTCLHAFWKLYIVWYRAGPCVNCRRVKQYLFLCRGAWSNGTPFAGTNGACTSLNQRWAKWVYIGSVLCYVSVTFFILLYQLVRNLRAVSVMLRGLEVCVSLVFLTCALHFLCAYWRLLGIYTRVDSIQSVEGLDKLD